MATVRKLIVEVVEARNLQPKDGHGTPSPYAVRDFYGQRRKTRTVFRDLNPAWNETLEFNVGKPSEVFGDMLELDVFHDRNVGPTTRNNFLGRVMLSSRQFVKKGEEALIYYPLEKKSFFSWIQGEIGLKIYFLDEVGPPPAPPAPPTPPAPPATESAELPSPKSPPPAPAEGSGPEDEKPNPEPRNDPPGPPPGNEKQHSLKKKFKDKMSEFQNLRESIHLEYRQVVERRVFTVTGTRADEETIDNLIVTGDSEQIFQKAIREQGRGQIMDTLAEIQERHDTVKELEKKLLDLQQIFLDMAVLVDAQGDMLDNIETQVSSARDHLQSGTAVLQKAKKLQKNSRKWMCIAIIILLIMIVIVVVGVLKPWSNNKGA